MNAIADGWEELLVSSSKILSPRSHIFIAGLSCDELVIIGGLGQSKIYDVRGDGYILEIPKMRLKPVIRDTDENIEFVAYSN